jgi:diguanylate cyclase (GGDEF)-like protein/PAS domain S-box-containing protein
MNERVREADKKILIVDDTPTNIDLLRQILRKYQMELFFASSGETALRLAPKIKPDLILMDVMMPGIDGFETCRSLKREAMFEEVPIIFITALDDTAALEKSFEAGGVDFISKPFRQEEVVRRVQTHLQIRNLMRERGQQIQKLQELNDKLALSEALNRTIVDSAADGIVSVDLDGTIISFNHAAERIFGSNGKQSIGQNINTFIRSAEVQNSSVNLLEQLLNVEHDSNAVGIRHDGNLFPVYIAVSKVQISGEVKFFTAIVRDISREKSMEEELQRLAWVDCLTGVGNRRSFDDRLRQEWKRASESNRPLGLLIYDIDHFKYYNDSFGHWAGDECLRTVSAAISKVMDGADAFVGRYGGDEFVIILPGADADAAEKHAETIRTAIEKLAIPHAEFAPSDNITLSIGVASTIPGVVVDVPEKLVKLADEGLYKAKAFGRNKAVLAEFSG